MSETNFDTIFGKMAVEQGLCTDEELKKCIAQLKARPAENPTTLGQLMIDLNIVTKAQADRLRASIRDTKGHCHPSDTGLSDSRQTRRRRNGHRL